MYEDNVRSVVISLDHVTSLGVIKLPALKGNRMSLLQQDTPNDKVGSIGVKLERLVKVGGREKRLFGDGHQRHVDILGGCVLISLI